ncbi:MAG: glycoside hydrolase family 3 N-terminal domain-containing protein [Luteimonas sp.]
MKTTHAAARTVIATGKRVGGTIATLVILLVIGITAGRTTPAQSADHTPTRTSSEPSAVLSTLAAADRRWVEATFASLDLDRKAAQILFVKTLARPRPLDSVETRQVLSEVRELGVGGLVLSSSELDTVVPYLNHLQTAAAIPLLVSGDFERSVAFRIDEGSVELPGTMAIGALASGGEAAARFAGELTARESRALGVHWALAPVADVNDNPANPVIGTRAFGEEPERVAALVAAFVEGARTANPPVLTSAKHFPGHGDTAVDSHHGLPLIASDRPRLDRVELVPFRAAIAAGVDSVMLGHLQVPAIDPSLAPATLSRRLTTTLLRDELAFHGLAVTDAMDMRGVGDAWMGAAAVRALAAGADVLLMPPDPRVAAQSIARAVREGQLSAARLDQAVLRVLAAKARMGLHRQRLVDAATARAAVGRSQDQARADDIASRAMTLVRNTADLVPLAVERPLRILHLVVANDAAGDNLAAPFDAELDQRRIPRQTRRIASSVSTQVRDALVADAGAFSHVLVSLHVRAASTRAGTGMGPSQTELLNALGQSGVPTVAIAFGSPYVAAQLPQVSAVLCAWGPWSANQRAAAQALFGERPIEGRLPVTIPGVAKVGEGLVVPRRRLGLVPVSSSPAGAAEAGFRPQGLDDVMRVLERFREQGAFPGGVIAVGRAGKLAMLRPFGRQSYDADAPAVSADTLYDLASLTKVVATTTMAMMMVDQDRLDLDAPVVSFLPGFVDAPGLASDKAKVSVRQLLAHTAGLAAVAPLFKEISGRAAYLERIQALPLAYAPGTETRYSDLGVIVLGEILERVAGVPLDTFMAEQVFTPLEMPQTQFFPKRPSPELLARIAPTERDAWRGRLVHGEVHDENAFALGGVAPHAGLFSTAGDLARFAQMLLNGGVLEHRRIVSRDTVALFTRRADLVPGSSRALGWDTRSPSGSSAGSLFSDDAFGHTGFTGTSIWIDPQRELFVILLTNRVHPTRDNNLIRAVRPAVADAVVAALAEPPVRVGLERVVAGEVPSLRGKRLGLVAHAASVTAAGTPAVVALREAGYTPVRLFSPEHGLAGATAAGEPVADAIDPQSGLPVVSLYGERARPRAADLAGLDALVFDLQDAGVRFYTYGATLFGCLDAAAEAGIPLIVLDRPNPLGGTRVEGPLAAARAEVKASAVNRLPGPLVHGLTLGEMARWENARRAAAGEPTARLDVIPMAGWTRTMSWTDTGRPWVAPSPNLRSASAALAYPGTALLEATNVSEGRGSAAPFLTLGAPWLPTESPTPDARGFRLTPTRFTPQASATAPAAKYSTIASAGWRVEVTDADRAEPYRLGITLLRALSPLPEFEWLRDGDGLTWLTGTPAVLARVRSDMSIAQIIAADAADHAVWRQARRAVLLYPD